MQSSPISGPKDYYHHCIPRFILRRFQIDEPLQGNKHRRRKSFQKALKKGINLEKIYVFNLLDGRLQTPSLNRVYGFTNLYRDHRVQDNVDHIEDKFSKLEGDASSIIRTMHDGLLNNKFQLSRPELGVLRKFLFLMHFRNAGLSSTYYEETNPMNARLTDWIKRSKETRKLSTSVDVWLEALDYYLNTDHQDIVSVGESVRERYGNQRVSEMLRTRFDPNIEDWYALDYESLANYFFLGVWEAADGSEFVLSQNGFGLWEGLIYGSPGAHRLYVMSPRIAVVLRRTVLHQPHSNDPSVLYSCLADVEISQPTIDYAGKDLLENLDPDDEWNVRKSYRLSALAQKDVFTFPVTKLTKTQTYAVNEVVMMNANLQHGGSITFASPDIMLRTLEQYMSSHNTFLGGKRTLYKPLLKELLPIQTATVTPISLDILSSSNADSDSDKQLLTFIRYIIMDGVSFPSTYNRAFLVYRLATDGPLANPISTKIRQIRHEAISKLPSFLDPPLPSLSFVSGSRTKVQESGTIVETLPKELFFAMIGYLVDQLAVASHSYDLLGNVIYDAAIIGVAHWMAKNRRDLLEGLLPWISVLN